MDIQNYIQQGRKRIDSVLETQLKVEATPLSAAMRYAVLNGGKRLRPLLTYAGAQAITGNLETADMPACAVELIHAYSLVHDDLPAMDDDDLRRGVPTCHIAFDEATAILAGDALQSLAFELLAEAPLKSVTSELRLEMILVLSKAIGSKGMVAGQSIDFHAAGSHLNETDLIQMHSLKTGALISASVQLGALSTGLSNAEDLAKLNVFSNCLGLAFQVQDDILDVEGDTKTLGKQQGKDEQLNKPTYTSMLGLNGAKRKAKMLCDEGIAALDSFGERGNALAGIARYIITRNH